MLAKKYRFHGHSSLKFVYSKGDTKRVKFLSLKYIANNRRSESRLAVVVSKKITKKAPERNRMRRRLYEAVRQQWPMIKPGYDLVIPMGIIGSNILVYIVRQNPQLRLWI